MESLKSSTEPRQGVLLVNLGSPREPTSVAVREFLEEFLSDPLVVDLPRWLWTPVRRWIVLPRRCPKVAALYREIWTDEGSPLPANTSRQAQLLARELGPAWRVAWAMRYGKPSIEGGLEALVRAGCREVVVLPLFPQNSRTTTGTVLSAASSACARMTQPPKLVSVESYATHPLLVRGWSERIRALLPEPEQRQPHVVLSFHGLPERYVLRGDPYRGDCEQSARAIAKELGLKPTAWTMAFQSKFGPGRWLGPATREVALELARRGERVLVASPAFVSDCLETLEELGQALRQEVERQGGRLDVVPCLNDHPAFIAALADLARQRGHPS
jgi:ferrochelatase